MLQVMELEKRQMLSAIVTLSPHGVLSVVADNAGDYLIAQKPNATTVEILEASNGGKTYDFPAAAVTSILFQGGAGTIGDYFSNNTSLPSTQTAGNNTGTNYLQGGKGNDLLVASPNPSAETYLTDPSGTNRFIGGPGFVNYFAGPGTDSFTLGSGYTALYSILAKNTITGRSTGTGYLIVNAGSNIASNLTGYQIVTFFQPGVSGNSAGNPGGPSAVLQPDANGNRILYLNQASGQTSTSFVVNPVVGEPGQITVTYTDSSGTNLTWAFHQISWIASFGPTGSNNTIINNTAINDVLYGGLPPGNHTLIGGFGINVLKGHSGNNMEVARGSYNDVSAGNGTDWVVLTGQRNASSPPVRELDVVRVNQAVVSTSVFGFQPGDVLVGVPRSLNHLVDQNDTDTTADNDDYVFWFAVERQRGSI